MSKRGVNCRDDIKKVVDKVSPHFYGTIKEFLLFIRSILDAGIELTENKIKKQDNQPMSKVEIK